MKILQPQIHDRASALDFLFGRINYERRGQIPYRSRGFKLSRMCRLLEKLGSPEHDLPVVHVAGTKGKGSTSMMIAAALESAGYRVGLYTSPHLERLEERFMIDRQACSAEQLVGLLAQIAPCVWEMDNSPAGHDGRLGPTYFEITTAAALLYFRAQQVDCAVLEVGLGGRLDSTNVCHPVLSVITSISLDHTRQLGHTLAAIAGEKAGIIKPRVPVITGVQTLEPLDVIRGVAAKRQARLLVLGHDFQCAYHVQRSTDGGQDGVSLGSGPLAQMDYREEVDGKVTQLAAVQLRLLGAHQAANAAVALAALHQLNRDGWRIAESAMRSGLASAYCPARVEIVHHRPTVVLDAAHNVASIRATLSVIRQSLDCRRRILLFATSRDKNALAMLDELLPFFDEVVLTRFTSNPRASDPQRLLAGAEQVKQRRRLQGLSLGTQPDPDAAWRHAASRATEEDLICITGSFFLAAELRKYFVQPVSTPVQCT